MLKHSKQNFPPLLFHKAALQSSDCSTLSKELVTALTSEKQQIFGLVLNAIDDSLSKADQIETGWTFDRIKLLRPIFQMALDNNICVVLTSDHGHVIENGTVYQTTDRAAAGGERWRIDDDKIENEELKIEGDRVLTDSHSLIAPWTAKMRYAAKKHGYHGGISLQEMLVPIGVLFPIGKKLSGWKPVVNKMPVWWQVLETSESSERSRLKNQANSLDNQDLEPDFGPLFQLVSTLTSLP